MHFWKKRAEELERENTYLKTRLLFISIAWLLTAVSGVIRCLE